MKRPEITQMGVLDCQVCVPASYTDKQVKSFANSAYMCGTSNGWHIRREGDKALAGCAERVPCKERQGFVHVMLDA